MRISLFVVAILGIVFLGSWLIFRVFKAYTLFQNPTIRLVSVILLIVLPLIFLFTNFIGQHIYSYANSIVYTFGAVWIGALLYFFIITVILGISYFLFSQLQLEILKIIGLSGFGLGIVLTVISIIIANTPVIKTFTVHSEELSPLWKDKTIVLFADTHAGLVRGKSFMEKVSRLVNNTNPDIVFIAGDIVDGPRIPVSFLDPIKNIRASLGVFYTPGNHESYSPDTEAVLTKMQSMTTMLVDKKIEINNTQIIGLDYRIEDTQDTEKRLLATGYSEEKPSIIIMHDPKNTIALFNKNVSLTLSGHTHCGQFFPITLIVKAMYREFTHGVHYDGPRASVTTCGVGTAGPPFRLGSRAEIVVIKIK